MKQMLLYIIAGMLILCLLSVFAGVIMLIWGMPSQIVNNIALTAFIGLFPLIGVFAVIHNMEDTK